MTTTHIVLFVLFIIIIVLEVLLVVLTRFPTDGWALLRWAVRWTLRLLYTSCRRLRSSALRRRSDDLRPVEETADSGVGGGRSLRGWTVGVSLTASLAAAAPEATGLVETAGSWTACVGSARVSVL